NEMQEQRGSKVARETGLARQPMERFVSLVHRSQRGQFLFCAAGQLSIGEAAEIGLKCDARGVGVAQRFVTLSRAERGFLAFGASREHGGAKVPGERGTFVLLRVARQLEKITAE